MLSHLQGIDTAQSVRAWRVVYSKPPFGSPEQVLAYLARYTYRVALSNSRLVRLEGDQVTFTYKDYAQGARVREMTLLADEFIRRFLLHVLPERFVRIRHYGLFANRHRASQLERCRELLGQSAAQAWVKEDWQTRCVRLTGRDPTLCPVCGQGHLRRVEELVLASSGSMGRPPP